MRAVSAHRVIQQTNEPLSLFYSCSLPVPPAHSSHIFRCSNERRKPVAEPHEVLQPRLRELDVVEADNVHLVHEYVELLDSAGHRARRRLPCEQRVDERARLLVER